MIDVTGVEISPKTSTSEAGVFGSEQLVPTIQPLDADNKNVEYVLSPIESGVTVDANGLVEWTDTSPSGEYVVTVITEDGSFEDTFILTLTDPEPDPEPEP